jgi:hypothetical protein
MKHMALTRSFKDTVEARADRDPAFRDALFAEGMDALRAVDSDTGKAAATIPSANATQPTSVPVSSLFDAGRRPR